MGLSRLEIGSWGIASLVSDRTGEVYHDWGDSAESPEKQELQGEGWSIMTFFKISTSPWENQPSRTLRSISEHRGNRSSGDHQELER
jgi:hypothetical protein